MEKQWWRYNYEPHSKTDQLFMFGMIVVANQFPTSIPYFYDQMPHSISGRPRTSRRAELNKRHPCLVAANGRRSIEPICLALEDRDCFAVSVKRGELIVGHIPRELCKRFEFSEVGARGGGGERRVTGGIFRNSNGFSASHRFVGMIMTVPHGPGLKQNFIFVHTRYFNLLPHFLVYAGFNKRRL